MDGNQVSPPFFEVSYERSIPARKPEGHVAGGTAILAALAPRGAHAGQ